MDAYEKITPTFRDIDSESHRTSGRFLDSCMYIALASAFIVNSR